MIVGVVGLGSIAHKHIAALREIDPHVRIIALRHSLSASSEDGVENVFSYEQLIEKAPNFIIISNPTSEHYHTIERLTPTEIPLFIEKPLFDQLKPLIHVKQLTYVACSLRFNEGLNYVRRHINGRRINEVNVYCGSYLPQWRPGIDWRNCYSANKEMGGGVHIDLIHEIDYLYWLFGVPTRTHKIFRNVSSLDISAIDYANYVLEYPNFTASVVLNYYRRDYKRTLEIVFDDETWTLDFAKNQVINNDGKILFKCENRFIDAYKTQLEHFIASLDNKEQFNTIDDAWQVLKICLN